MEYQMTKIKVFKEGYAADDMRGIDDPRPWDTIEEIKKYAGSDKKLLDIGCGYAHKTLDLADSFQEVYGIDPSPDMLALAQSNVKKSGKSNAHIQYGVDEQLPFGNNFFDVVICILALWNVDEIHRVLKPGGIFILETTGAKDKLDLKKEFGEDEQGLRGQRANYGEQELIDKRKAYLEQKLENVTVTSGCWRTYYTAAGIDNLLQSTPTIRDFDPEKDREAVERVRGKFSTENGIAVEQNR